MTFVLIK